MQPRFRLCGILRLLRCRNASTVEEILSALLHVCLLARKLAYIPSRMFATSGGCRSAMEGGREGGCADLVGVRRGLEAVPYLPRGLSRHLNKTPDSARMVATERRRSSKGLSTNNVDKSFTTSFVVYGIFRFIPGKLSLLTEGRLPSLLTDCQPCLFLFSIIRTHPFRHDSLLLLIRMCKVPVSRFLVSLAHPDNRPILLVQSHAQSRLLKEHDVNLL